MFTCAGVLQDKDLFVQFTDPNMLDVWVCFSFFLLLSYLLWHHARWVRTVKTHNCKVIQIDICSALVGFIDWSVHTQPSSTPSSWSCTPWQAACPRSPAPAPLATSPPVPTAICLVSIWRMVQETQAVYSEPMSITKSWTEFLLTIRDAMINRLGVNYEMYCQLFW